MSIAKLISESKQRETYFNTYTAAVNYAVDNITKMGYDEPDAEMLADLIGLKSNRPKRGQTTIVDLPLFKNGKEQRKQMHIQVYNRETDTGTYELNFYVL